MRREKSPVKLTVAATAALLVVGTLTGAGVHYAGDALLFSAGPVKTVEAAATETAALQLKTTPAETALTKTLQHPPEGWKESGDIRLSDAAPPPYSCPLPGRAPAAALSRSFDAAGTTVKVTLTAYTAGLGAEAIGELNAAFERCAGPGAYPGWDHMYGQTPGTESYFASVNRSGAAYRTASFRRGDVIAYVSGSADFGTLQSLSVALDSVLAAQVDPVCTDTGSTAQQSSRSLWARAGYTPYKVPAEVKIQDPGLPASKGKNAPAPVSLPGPDLETSQAFPADLPEYPVWPPMPKPVPLPQEPASPAPAPVLSATVSTLALDAAGPGCGWAFTGTSAPVFDAAAAEKANSKARTGAAAKLTAGAKAWSADVLAYWKEYAAYAQQVKTYSAYAQKVSAVNEAWSAIDTDWADFYTRANAYDAAVAARADFDARRAAAEKDYAARIQECAERPVPAPKPSPSPSASPSPEPSPSASPNPTASPGATPTPSPEPTPEPSPEPEPEPEPCDTSRPEILDEQAPEVPEKPVAPADPRPADQR